MFFSDVVEKLKEKGFVLANGEDDFEEFLVSLGKEGDRYGSKKRSDESNSEEPAE